MRKMDLDLATVERVKQVALKRPSFGTRTTAGVLTREIGVPVNRKKVQRIFRALNWVTPAMKKSETMCSKVTPPTRIWLGYAFDTRAGRENAIMSVNNALASNPRIDSDRLALRIDNGSQYRSREFNYSMKAIGIKLEFIFVNTPEQNGHIESFQKTIKKEYLWSNDIKDYQEVEAVICDAFRDYNEEVPHSSLNYKTPYEFLSDWEMKQKV
jgi:putative transposase